MSLESDRPSRSGRDDGARGPGARQPGPGARGPGAHGAESIGRLVSRLLARTGYDQQQAPQRLAAAWTDVVPAGLAGLSRPGRVRRGVLEVLVSHSAAVQEMGYHKAALIRRLAEVLPDESITDIRCRLAAGIGAEGGDRGAPESHPHDSPPSPA